MKFKYVEKVYKDKQCCSCGLCIGICKQEAVSYKYDKYGFLQPVIDAEKCINCSMCTDVCPGNKYYKNNLKCDLTGVNIVYGYSNNEMLNQHAASGGIVTEMLAYMINRNIVDYAVFVPDNYYECGTVVSDDIDMIYRGKTSKYCPVVFGKGIKYIKPKDKKYAIVGLPCQIAALRKYYKKYENNIFFISLMCNHVPSKRFTDFIYETFKVDKREKIKYRGNGWPGDISIGDKVRLPFRKTFRLFNKYFYNWRCKVCNDHFGEFSDMAVGDAYFLKEKAMSKGNTACLIFNPKMEEILWKMHDEGIISLKKLDASYEFIKSAKTLINRTHNIEDLLRAGGRLNYKRPDGLEKEDSKDVHSMKILRIIIDEIENRYMTKKCKMSGVFRKRKLEKKLKAMNMIGKAD